MTINEQSDLAANGWPYPGVATVHALVTALGLDGQPVTAQAAAVRQFMASPAWTYAPPVLQRDVSRWLGLLYAAQAEFTGTITAQVTDLSWRDAWLHEIRGHRGEWVRGLDAPVAADPAILGIGGSGGVSAGTRKTIGEFMNAADDHIPAMFGHGRYVHLDWDHKDPTIYPDSQHKGYLAFIDWNGHMNFSATTAQHLDQALHGTGPVDDPDAVLVPLHELIHAVVPRHQSRSTNGDMEMYQKPAGQAIEEGFTQLGAANHAEEFFNAIGVGGRPTSQVSDDGTRNQTMAEYARAMADPDAIRNDESWGHYAEWTADALNWVTEISRRQGGQRTPQQLSDQISSAGTASKPRVMAEQLLSASGLGDLSPQETRQALQSAQDQIIESWGKNAAADVAEQATAKMRGTVAAMRGMTEAA